MKTLLLLLLVASLLTIDNPKINEIRGKLIDVISNIARSEYSENKITDKVSLELESHFDSFTENEEAFLTPFLGEPDGLIKFYRDYCQHDQFQSAISDINRQKVCHIIEPEFDAIEDEAIRNS